MEQFAVQGCRVRNGYFFILVVPSYPTDKIYRALTKSTELSASGVGLRDEANEEMCYRAYQGYAQYVQSSRKG